MLAVFRASEICIGIVCAGVVLAGTDLGGARRRLATLFAGLSAEIAGRFAGTLASPGPNLPETQPIRRELVRRVIALDPVIDEALGESSQLRYHSPVLQKAVDGLLAALAGWRTVAVHARAIAGREARQEANAVLQNVPQELRISLSRTSRRAGWLIRAGLRRICEAAVRRLIALPAGTPSLRLLADQTAEVLAGISHALNGLALLVDDPARPVRASWRLPPPRARLAPSSGQCRACVSSRSVPSSFSGSSPHGRTAREPSLLPRLASSCSRREPTRLTLQP